MTTISKFTAAAVGSAASWPRPATARWLRDAGTPAMCLRALAIWAVILVLAIVNGAVRNALITPLTGELAGHVISTILLSVLIILLVRRTVRWVGPASRGDAFFIGGMWLVLTLAFELLAGHYLFGASWERLLADYDVLRGRVWPLVPLTLFLAPVWAHRREHTTSARVPLTRAEAQSGGLG